MARCPRRMPQRATGRRAPPQLATSRAEGWVGSAAGLLWKTATVRSVSVEFDKFEIGLRGGDGVVRE